MINNITLAGRLTKDSDLRYTSDGTGDGIRQTGEQFSKTYLVATRMNCLRRVSFEDIEYIGR